MTNYYVKTLEYTPSKPSSCITCGRDNLVDGIVIARIGLDNSNLNTKENTLCLFCETLMIITSEPKAAITLQPSNSDDKVTFVHKGGR